MTSKTIWSKFDGHDCPRGGTRPFKTFWIWIKTKKKRVWLKIITWPIVDFQIINVRGKFLIGVNDFFSVESLLRMINEMEYSKTSKITRKSGHRCTCLTCIIWISCITCITCITCKSHQLILRNIKICLFCRKMWNTAQKS